MRTKQILRKAAWSVLAIVLMVVAVFALNVNVAPVASASVEDAGVKTLFTPTATGENYTVGNFSDWEEETAVEDYADSPTGKVLHHTINNMNSAGGELYPGISVSIPYDGDASDFAGYIVWLEYEGEVYSDLNYWGLFNLTFASESNTVSHNRPITFIDANGSINETKTGGWCYHRNNQTPIENSGYANAYSYSFKGYMIIPKTMYGADVAPNESTVINLSHHNAKNMVLDLKIGEIGYYTDYNAVLNEYGRCNY